MSFLELFLKVPVLFCNTIKPCELFDLLFFVINDRKLFFCFLEVLSLNFQYSNLSDIPAKYYDKIYFQWTLKQNLKIPETIIEYDQLLKVFSQISICKFLIFLFNFFKIFPIRILINY